MRFAILLTAGAWLASTIAAEAIVVYDSQGFDGYTVGDVDGQIGGTRDAGAGQVGDGSFEVINANIAVNITDIGGAHGKVLDMSDDNELGNFGSSEVRLHAGWSAWAGAGARLEVEYDMYAVSQFAIFGSPDGVSIKRDGFGTEIFAAGLEDSGGNAALYTKGETLPTTGNLFPPQKIADVPRDQWFNVKYIWDQPAGGGPDWGEVSVLIDGVLEGQYSTTFQAFRFLDGVSFVQAVNGNDFTADTLYYDNVKITVVPEPTSVALISLGVLGLFAGRRQRI